MRRWRIAREFLAELGEALGAAGEVVIVPGNHDHHLLGAWLERRARRGPPPPLGLESPVDWRAGEPLATLARHLGAPAVRAAYPGVWLRDDVYAMHGHYSARHTTIPMFERLGAGAMARFLGEAPGGPARAEDYEATLAPIYAWIHAVAQSAGGNVAGSQRASSRAWRALAGGSGRRSLRRRAVVTGFPAVVAGLNRAGLGPLQSDVSMPALSHAGLRATAQVITGLGVSAPHVIFGHTHRAGPLPGDDETDWATPDGRMINAGCWVYDRQFVNDGPRSAYWPGTCVALEEERPPELRRLLGDFERAELEPEDRPPDVRSEPSGMLRRGQVGNTISGGVSANEGATLAYRWGDRGARDVHGAGRLGSGREQSAPDRVGEQFGQPVGGALGRRFGNRRLHNLLLRRSAGRGEHRQPCRTGGGGHERLFQCDAQCFDGEHLRRLRLRGEQEPQRHQGLEQQRQRERKQPDHPQYRVQPGAAGDRRHGYGRDAAVRELMAWPCRAAMPTWPRRGA